MLSSPVTLRSLQPGVTSVVLVLEPSRVLDLWTTSDGPTKTEPVHAFVHRAVQRPTTAGVEVYPRHRARVLGPRHLRLAGLEERSASGRLWTRDGRLLEFHDLPTAPAGLQTRATAAWRGPGAVTVDIVRPDALSHAVLHVLIADRAYGLSAASAAARTDMGRRGARAAFRDLPPETRCRFAALWPADYDLFLLDDHGVVLAVGACRVRSGGQTLCTLSCGRGTLLRVRNTASGKPRGFALISARQGILMRRTVPPGKQVEVGWLPQGRYQLRGWTKDSGIRPACLELDLGSTPARTVELPLR